MTGYDNKCIFYLGLEIIKLLGLDNNFLYIDDYYYIVTAIYNDYKQYDNTSKSLLESINDYILDNKDYIADKIKKAIIE